jgi:hypothetical protein
VGGRAHTPISELPHGIGSVRFFVIDQGYHDESKQKDYIQGMKYIAAPVIAEHVVSR